MNKLETKLETVKDILTPFLTGASPQKRKYANELMGDIVFEINKAEVNNELLLAKLNGYSNINDYQTQVQKSLDILVLMGANSVDLNTMRKDCLNWITQHREGVKRPFTFGELAATCRMVAVFEACNDRMPNDLTELKNWYNSDENLELPQINKLQYDTIKLLNTQAC